MIALVIAALAAANRAQTPPMGWNSWDAFGASVREDEIRANADVMARKLKKHGWEYVVVDIQWYEPTANGSQYHAGAKLDMDSYGRLIPSLNRFPSAAGDKGFAPLARYVHGLGLKFGIHILRGIPRQAVAARTPIFGTNLTAADVADRSSTCPWNSDMYGVKPAGQAYYDSLLELYKSWGVDFIKVDDLSRPYHKDEIEMIRRAIDRFAPNIVFSASPGETPIEEADHAEKNLNMWRMSDDFWDRWGALVHAFELCARWQCHAGPGHWPDADMLPLGHIGIRNSDNGGDRQTHFTRDEQVTMMTLWCIARSPLMLGCNLPDLDPWTQSLLTNDEVLEVLKRSSNNRQLSRDGDLIVWTADAPAHAHYFALFNLRDTPVQMTLPVPEPTRLKARDLWTHKDLAANDSLFVPAHGARLVRVR